MLQIKVIIERGQLGNSRFPIPFSYLIYCNSKRYPEDSIYPNGNNGFIYNKQNPREIIQKRWSAISPTRVPEVLLILDKLIIRSKVRTFTYDSPINASWVRVWRALDINKEKSVFFLRTDRSTTLRPEWEIQLKHNISEKTWLGVIE